MPDISEVIGWKFNHQPGMSTRDGVITAFPGGIPSQADQDAWTTEYVAAQVIEIRNSDAKNKLERIDRESVRGLREFIMTKFADDPDLPTQLLDHEAAAILERAKIV